MNYFHKMHIYAVKWENDLLFFSTIRSSFLPTLLGLQFVFFGNYNIIMYNAQLFLLLLLLNILFCLVMKTSHYSSNVRTFKYYFTVTDALFEIIPFVFSSDFKLLKNKTFWFCSTKCFWLWGPACLASS